MVLGKQQRRGGVAGFRPRNIPSWMATNLSTEAIEAVITIAGQIGTCDPEELDTVNVTVS